MNKNGEADAKKKVEYSETDIVNEEATHEEKASETQKVDADKSAKEESIEDQLKKKEEELKYTSLKLWIPLKIQETIISNNINRMMISHRLLNSPKKNLS
mgnify:CR=1 FL=1